ncbi:hypothetical protein L596_006518 [Steinernema carpocapsae]|uniref:Uncharacterized protein n=1 Tax=Steinernema carpocapsae TaxID=34508 RepID=A0A4U8V4J1_STECR|nr:hypothetical protein L596_006518 [Steinernema carpocapsae]
MELIPRLYGKSSCWRQVSCAACASGQRVHFYERDASLRHGQIHLAPVGLVLRQSVHLPYLDETESSRPSASLEVFERLDANLQSAAYRFAVASHGMGHPMRIIQRRVLRRPLSSLGVLSNPGQTLDDPGTYSEWCPSVYLANHALEACKIVTGCDDVSASEVCAFGRSILQAEVSTEAKRPILRSVWRRMSKLSSLRSYVQCCDVWIEFTARFFSIHEVNVILDSLLKKIVPDKKYENFYESLLSIVQKLVEHVNDICDLVLLAKFRHFDRTVPRGRSEVEVCLEGAPSGREQASNPLTHGFCSCKPDRLDM